MTKPIPELTPEQQARFWALVDVRGPDECWHWRGKPDAYGYGRIKFGLDYRVHRVSMAINGRDPLNMLACHRCDNPPCVNPRHLYAGTPNSNMADKVSRGRQSKGPLHIASVLASAVRGDKHPSSKLSSADVLNIRASLTPNVSLARQYGVSRKLISAIKLRHVWKHI